MKQKIIKNRQSRTRLEEWYQRFLRRIHVPVSEYRVMTTFGAVHILTSGDSAKPPLVCLHSMRTSSAHLMAELGPLAERFHIIAPDLPGQSVRGLNTRMSFRDDSLSEWLLEIVDKLYLDEIHLLGVGIGGFAARKFATFKPDRVSSLTLIVPAGIVASPVKGFMQMALPMIRYKLNPTDKKLQRLVRPLMTTWDQEWAGYLADAMTDFTPDFRIPPLATDDELKRLPMPCLVLAAEEDISFPGKEIISRITHRIKHVETELLQGCKHCPPTTDDFRNWMSFRVTLFLIQNS